MMARGKWRCMERMCHTTPTWVKTCFKPNGVYLFSLLRHIYWTTCVQWKWRLYWPDLRGDDFKTHLSSSFCTWLDYNHPSWWLSHSDRKSGRCAVCRIYPSDLATVRSRRSKKKEALQPSQYKPHTHMSKTELKEKLQTVTKEKRNVKRHLVSARIHEKTDWAGWRGAFQIPA